MPIATLQRQMRQLGRIRTGIQVDAGPGKRRPERLDTFRLTSRSRDLIVAAAERYGGIVTPWAEEWQVVTGADALDIIVPPGEPVSQWLELWTAAGCIRRCDGVVNVLTGGPCECPADVAERVKLAKTGGACRATTRLSVILPGLPDLGVWTLESHGFYAAVELAGAAEVLSVAASAGRLMPATLRLEKRSKRIPGNPPTTHHYTVPVIEIRGALGDVPGLAMLEPGERRVPALPSTTLPDSSDFRGPGLDEITPAQLRAGLVGLGIDLAEARLLANDAYGDHELNGAERADFLARLRRRAGQ